jgi:hypothetical protein
MFSITCWFDLPLRSASFAPERRLDLAFRTHLKANLDAGRSPLTLPATGKKKATKPLVA